MIPLDKDSVHHPAALVPLGLVLEDQPAIRAWLAELLGRTFPGVEVVAVATLKAARAWLAALKAASPRRPVAVALVDLGLPDGNGIEFIGALAAACPEALPVVTTVYDDDAHLFDALAAGARGYLLKDEDPEALARALGSIERGEPPLSPAIAHRILAHFRGTRPAVKDDAGLTAREIEVLTFLGRGLTVPETARRLGLTPNTIASYVKTIYQKLNVSRRAELALEARRRGLA
jgi:DNA-binding NarL/FixJ family response regulator